MQINRIGKNINFGATLSKEVEDDFKNLAKSIYSNNTSEYKDLIANDFEENIRAIQRLCRYGELIIKPVLRNIYQNAEPIRYMGNDLFLRTPGKPDLHLAQMENYNLNNIVEKMQNFDNAYDKQDAAVVTKKIINLFG